MIWVVGTLPPGPGIVVALPHVSHLGGPILAACLSEAILWGVDPESMETQPWKAGLWLTCLLTGAEIVPLSSDKPFGMRALAKRLRAGGKVGIFPEGGINRTSAPLLPLQAGAARLSILCGVPIIPVRISGMRECFFSPAPAEKKMILPTVKIEIGEPFGRGGAYC